MTFWKKKARPKYDRSFAKRLTWNIMLRMALIMLLPVFLLFWLGYAIVHFGGGALCDRLLAGDYETIRRVTSDLYVAATNTAPVIAENLDKPDKLQPIMDRLPQAVPNSFAEWMNAAEDVDLVITHPKSYELDPKFVGNARVEYDQKKAFEGADFIYAKNWSNPGVTCPEDYGKITCEDRSWTVDTEHMSWTNNGKFMHCLPVRRNLIVTDDVIESENSLVIPEAANREISCSVVLKRMLEALVTGQANKTIN